VIDGYEAGVVGNVVVSERVQLSPAVDRSSRRRVAVQQQHATTPTGPPNYTCTVIVAASLICGDLSLAVLLSVTLSAKSTNFVHISYTACQNGTKFSALRDLVLLDIGSKIGELYFKPWFRATLKFFFKNFLLTLNHGFSPGIPPLAPKFTSG